MVMSSVLMVSTAIFGFIFNAFPARVCWNGCIKKTSADNILAASSGLRSKLPGQTSDGTKTAASRPPQSLTSDSSIVLPHRTFFALVAVLVQPKTNSVATSIIIKSVFFILILFCFRLFRLLRLPLKPYHQPALYQKTADRITCLNLVLIIQHIIYIRVKGSIRAENLVPVIN